MDDLLSPFVLIASIVRNRHHAFHSPEARPGALARGRTSPDGDKVTADEEPSQDPVKRR